MENETSHETKIHDVTPEPTPVHAKPSHEVPAILQVLGVLMCVAGVFHIFIGFPLLLLLGFGLIPMALGVAEFVYGMKIFRAKKEAYMPALIIGSLALIFEVMISNAIGALLAGGFLYVVYSHKAEFSR